MAKLEELKQIPLGWRFTEKKYNIVEEEDFRDVVINSESESQQKWIEYTGSREFHLMKLPISIWSKWVKINEINLDWGEENSAENSSLLKLDLLEPNDKITFFWGGSNSLILNWNIFLKYWDDFCYPSDDTNLIVCIKKGIYITYIEDTLSIYRINSCSI